MLPNGLWNDGLAVLAGLIACGFDLKWRKIPNWLTISALILGLGGHAVFGWESGAGALWGCLTGLVLLAIPFIAGGIGGGDVKLMMALGAFLGVVRIFWVFVYAGIAGGMISLLYLVRQLGISGAFLRLRLMLEIPSGRQQKETPIRTVTGHTVTLPYAVAIFCGLGWELILKWDMARALWG
jgi:prepilin peptidase CpaA